MLLISLFLVGFLNIFLYLLTRSQLNYRASILYSIGAFVLIFLSGATGAFFPPLFLNAFLLIIFSLICVFKKPELSFFTKGLVVCSAISFLIPGVPAFLEFVEIHRLKEKYPLVSIAERLDYEKEIGEDANKEFELYELTSANLDMFEDCHMRKSNTIRRARSLFAIHHNTLEHFVNSPGFGVQRRLRPSISSIELEDQDPVAIPEPEIYPESDSGTPDLAENQNRPSISNDEAWTAHLENTIDFVDPDSLGYTQDLEHVAGFLPHQMERTPVIESKGEALFVDSLEEEGEPKNQTWVLKRVELVSLLKYESPKVYVSKNLPSMKELVDAKVREPSQFESKSIKALYADNDFLINEKTNQIELLGSIRATEKCLQCHQVKRGTLLGAFSYEFVRRKPIKEKETDTEEELQ